MNTSFRVDLVLDASSFSVDDLVNALRVDIQQELERFILFACSRRPKPTHVFRISFTIEHG